MADLHVQAGDAAAAHAVMQAVHATLERVNPAPSVARAHFCQLMYIEERLVAVLTDAALLLFETYRACLDCNAVLLNRVPDLHRTKASST